ncbi:hypothetical protein T484DRAFT_1787672 [Baffinella frigidus]|nr:hypothetical protein T484DRAFT_1787672 [Cryptophyta sp. CCMP2293]
MQVVVSFFGVVVSFVGVACIGLLTASMAHSLSWTPEEVSALMVIDREKGKTDAVSALMVIDREKGKIESRKYAARIILRWLQREMGKIESRKYAARIILHWMTRAALKVIDREKGTTCATLSCPSP